MKEGPYLLDFRKSVYSCGALNQKLECAPHITSLQLKERTAALKWYVNSSVLDDYFSLMLDINKSF